MNISYMLYQAERPRSAAELRDSDVQAGEFAAAAVRLARSVRHAFTGVKDTGRGSGRPVTATAPCVIARPQ